MKFGTFIAFLLTASLLVTNTLAALTYSETDLVKLQNVYELSGESIEFLTEHNVPSSVFPNVTKETLNVVLDHESGHTWSVDYDERIKSISMQTAAYGFSDEQVAALVKSEMPYNHRIGIVVPKYPDRIYIDLPRTFDVFLNGEIYDSANCDYPMLFYRDITYLPLTADNLAYLGLSVKILQDGVKVEKADVTSDKHSAHTTPIWIDPLYKPLYIPDVSVTVDEKELSADYRFIMYKSVYYMPLTWEIMCGILGWSYSFDHENGLCINTAGNVQ